MIVLIQFSSFRYKAGEWDTQSEKEMCKQEERKVKKVMRHEQYARSTLVNDVILLELTEPYTLTPFINTICLPPSNTRFEGQRCFTSGWGKNKFGRAGVYQAYMKKLSVPIVPHAKCQEQLRMTRLGPDFILHEKFLCAGRYGIKYFVP